jgi:ABC-type antimicrobial peptide transport system permease subunit
MGLPLAALTLPLYLVVPTFYAEALGVPLSVVGAILLGVIAAALPARRASRLDPAQAIRM